MGKEWSGFKRLEDGEIWGVRNNFKFFQKTLVRGGEALIFTAPFREWGSGE